MSTLAKSGALFELHARNAERIALQAGHRDEFRGSARPCGGRGIPAAAALKRMGLPQSEWGDFRQRTRREANAHRCAVHRAVVKIKKTELSRNLKSAI